MDNITRRSALLSMIKAAAVATVAPHLLRPALDDRQEVSVNATIRQDCYSIEHFSVCDADGRDVTHRFKAKIEAGILYLRTANPRG